MPKNTLYFVACSFCFFIKIHLSTAQIPEKQTDTISHVNNYSPRVISLKDTLHKDTIYITGMVTATNGNALEEVNIKTSAGDRGITNSMGGFKIPYHKGMKITASRIGYNDTIFTVNNIVSFLNIELSTNTAGSTLSDVQVTALGISKNSRSVGYSVTDIKGDAVQTAKESNFVNALQGKVAGVQINTNDGSMGGSTKVTVRGNKSITGNNNALFVVDGVFMQNQNLSPSVNQQIGGGGYDYGSPIQDINPDDIQT